MNKTVNVIIIGAGDRGNTYAQYSKLHPDEMKVIGIAEPIDKRRKVFANVKDHDK